jgi:hypothetical protein
LAALKYHIAPGLYPFRRIHSSRTIPTELHPSALDGSVSNSHHHEEGHPQRIRAFTTPFIRTSNPVLPTPLLAPLISPLNHASTPPPLLPLPQPKQKRERKPAPAAAANTTPNPRPHQPQLPRPHPPRRHPRQKRRHPRRRLHLNPPALASKHHPASPSPVQHARPGAGNHRPSR